MPLETASTIADLVTTNPVGASDTPAALDDHIRLIKTVLKADAFGASTVHAATGKTTPVDNDEIPLTDSAASYGKNKLTWANLKATAKTYFDSLYLGSSSPTITSGAITFSDSTQMGTANSLGGFKNKIINGGMQIYQRGSATLTSSGAYFVDRFTGWIQSGTSVTGTLTRDGISGFDSGYAALFSGSWTTGQATIRQRIEGDNCANLNNQNITISAKVRHDFGSATNFYIKVYRADVKDNFTTTIVIGTSTAQSVADSATTAISYTVNAGANADYGLQIDVYAETNTVSSKNVRFGAIQIEVGSVATPFELRSIGQELALCQRYTRPLGRRSGGLITTTDVRVPVEHIGMRSAPSLSPASTITASGIANSTLSSPALTGGTADGSLLTGTVTATTSGSFVHISDTSGTSLLISEL